MAVYSARVYSLSTRPQPVLKYCTMKKLIAPLFALIVIAAVAAVWLAPSGLARMPSFEATTLDGQTLSSQQLAGKPVFLTFWATSCVTCVAEIPHLVDLHQRYAERGFEVIAIAMDYDPIGHIKAMQQTRQLPYRIAHDSDGKIAEAFGKVRLTPTNLLIDPSGHIVFKKIGEIDFKRLEQQIAGML